MDAHDPLDEEAYDPLDELPELNDRLISPGSDPDFGFRASVDEAMPAVLAVHTSRKPKPSKYSPPDTSRRQRSFLRCIAQTDNRSLACAAAGITPWTLGKWKKDPAFVEALEDAQRIHSDILLAEALSRAVHGERKAIYHKGEVVGYETVKSDRLLERMLEASMPEKFGRGDRKGGGQANEGGVLLLPAAVPLSEWTAQAAIQQAKFRERKEDE